MAAPPGRLQLAVPPEPAVRIRRLAPRHGRHRAGAAGHQADHRRRHHRPHPLADPLGGGAAAGRRRGLRLHPGPSLLRRSAGPRRPARHAQRPVPLARPARRPSPGPAGHRPGGRACDLRPPAGQRSALDAADDDRLPADVRHVAGRDGLAVSAAHPGRAGHGPCAVVGFGAQPQAPVPGHLGRPAGGGRSRGRGGRRDRRRPGGQGLRPGGPGTGQAGAGLPRPVRRPAPVDPAQRPLQPGDAGDSGPGPGCRPGLRRLAGRRRPGHARDLRRLLHLRRADDRPGADADHGHHGRPAGPGGRGTRPAAGRRAPAGPGAPGRAHPGPRPPVRRRREGRHPAGQHRRGSRPVRQHRRPPGPGRRPGVRPGRVPL